MEKEVLIKCDCGCSILTINEYDWKDGTVDYSISSYINAFDSNNISWIDILKKKIQIIFMVILNKEYTLYEIVMTQEQMDKFKKDMEII